jgi:tartrate-resistant acid phosphatase type 5
MAGRRKFTRRELLLGAGAFLAGSHLDLGSRVEAGGSGGLSFLVIGDWGTGGAGQRALAAELARTAARTGAQFVISTGDNFYPKGVRSIGDAGWITKFEVVYRQEALQIPWFIALGNHDHQGSVKAQIAYSTKSSRWRLPAPYYAIRKPLDQGEHAEFFFLDTTPIRRAHRLGLSRVFGNRQMRWLEKALAESTARWKIVIGHHAVFSGGRHGNTPALERALPPLFERYGVQAYFNGHDHHLEHSVFEGRHYFTSGAGAKPRPAKATRLTKFIHPGALGFLTAKLDASALQVTFHDVEGKPLHHAVVPARLPRESDGI